MRPIRPTPITATRSGGDPLPDASAGAMLTALSGISVLPRATQYVTVAGAFHWNAPTACQRRPPLSRDALTPRERRRGADSTGRWSRARSDAARGVAHG